MLAQRWRPVLFAALGILLIWVAAITAYSIAKHSRVTAEKLRAYAESIDLKKLSAEQRAEALRKLAAMLNALPPEERQKARVERTALRWFEQMTEEEKGAFIEATMPTGFKQMSSAFEQLPEDKRNRAINDAVRRMREAQSRVAAESGESMPDDTNAPPPLSPELQAKIREIGLKTFYSQSSAQSKAELAPLLEELQRSMERSEEHTS